MFSWGHVKCTLATCGIFFAKIWLLSLRDQKRSKNYSPLQKSLKTFRCTRRLQFWDIWQKNTPKFNKFAQRPKTLSKVSSFHRNVLKMFLWRLWMEFWQSCEYFLSNCSNFSARNPKNDLKKKISTTLLVQIFFCFSWLFLWHPDYFLSIDKKNCSNSRTDERTKLFFVKSTFSQKMSLDARIAVVTTREKNFFPTKRFLDQSTKKCEKLFIFQKLFFPKNFHRYIDCGFRKSGRNFRWR